MKRKILMIAVFAILILASGCTTEDDSLDVICIMPEETTTVQTFSPTETTSLTPEVTESPEDNVTGWKADGIIGEGEYENNVTGFRDLFYIHWTSDNETLYMGIQGKTSGYVAVGFNPVAMMKNADIILGGNIGTGGSLYIYDMYSLDASGTMRSDTSLGGEFNIEESAGTEKAAFQTLEFSRKLDTGDKYDSVLEKGKSAKVVWFLSNYDDPLSNQISGEGSVDIII
ncbi:DOMON domain-containing protein [Methanolacinia paynteri]|uniref:DOMON domain-containing protein n=1 Tax=Methanolacinia paynteri TaxID=230356 RepID=UPI0006949AE0|nr:DOMON domain-containing protein [Methanolacinia paynteri]